MTDKIALDESLTPVERLRLAVAMTEIYDDGIFECDPEYVKALLQEYDELKDQARRPVLPRRGSGDR